MKVPENINDNPVSNNQIKNKHDAFDFFGEDFDNSNIFSTIQTQTQQVTRPKVVPKQNAPVPNVKKSVNPVVNKREEVKHDSFDFKTADNIFESISQSQNKAQNKKTRNSIFD